MRYTIKMIRPILLSFIVLGTVLVGVSWWRLRPSQSSPPPVVRQVARHAVPAVAGPSSPFSSSTPPLQTQVASSSPSSLPITEISFLPFFELLSVSSTGEAFAPATPKASSALPLASPAPAAPAVSSSTPLAPSAASSSALLADPSSPAPSSTPLVASTASSTSTPSSSSSRTFTINGQGFCTNNPGSSSIFLRGYPLVNDFTIPPGLIASWSDTQVVFTVPDSVPTGKYAVVVRGYLQTFGYCSDIASSSFVVAVP